MMDIFELPPKTQEERKAKASNVTIYSDLFQRVITTEEIIQRVVHYLTLKALVERKTHDERNKTPIGNATFWFKNIQDEHKVVIRSELASNLYPSEWNFEKILIALEDKEKNFYVESGAEIAGIDYPMANQNTNIS